MPSSDIELFISSEEEKVYIEMAGFIRFLRSTESLRDEDEVYNNALRAIASYLEDKQNEFLAAHIMVEEAKAAKEKGRLN